MDDPLTGPQSDPGERTAFIGPDTDADSSGTGGPSASTVPDVGSLQGRYVVLEMLGRGAMGCVLRAYDPKLQREVALKIVSGHTLDPNARERMLREAQAMAQLSHANVVAVYDAEESEAGVVLVMEYVPGRTLRGWVRGKARPWSQVVACFVQAGRGLAAAHSVGLLHRDFKPDNVLVAESGVVKVTDFGLAKLSAGPKSQAGWSQAGESFGRLSSGALDSQTSGSIDVALTRVGTVMGTPRYMAPEQHLGEELGPAADQYAFCVSLWEALVGTPPHRGKDLEALLQEKLREAPAWPSGAPALPRSLLDALRRGLAVEPSERFSSVEALLEALAYDPRRRRNQWLGGLAGLGVVGVLGVGSWSWSQARAQQCTGAREHLAGVWDEARRAQVGAAMLGDGASFAGPVWTRTEAELDRYADAWVAMHTEACEATTLRGEQSIQVMDLRMGCLHRARLGLEAVTKVLADADADVTRNASDVVGSLSALERCADVQGLQAEVEPPRPEEAAAVESIRRGLAQAEAEVGAGRFTRGLELVELAQREQLGIDYGPVDTEVSLVAGNVLEELARYGEAEAELRRGLESGARWHQWELMQKAAVQLMFVVGYEQRRMAEGHQLWALVVGLAGDDPIREASAHNVLANVFVAEGRLAEAETEHRRALALWEAELEPEDVDIATSRSNLALVLHARGNYEEAETESRRALAQIEQALGPEHPKASLFHNNLANALSAAGKQEEAEAELRRALALTEQALGPEHLDVAISTSNLAQVLYAEGKLDEAEALHRRGLAVRERRLEPGHPDLGQSHNNLANVLYGQARYAEAEAELREALLVLEAALGPEHADVAQSHGNLGLVLHAEGKEDQALAELQRALELWERALGPEHPTVAIGLNNIALVRHAKGEYEEAEVLYRRTLMLQEKVLGPEHPNIALTLNNLAQVLVARGKLQEAEVEHRRGLALLIEAMGPEHPDVARARNNLGLLLADLGKPAQAEVELRLALALWEKALGSEHPNVAIVRHNLAKRLLADGRGNEALVFAEQAWARRERDDVLPEARAATAFVLARALWITDPTGPSRGRAKALAEQAASELERIGEVDDAQDVRAWLRRPKGWVPAKTHE